ncbi:S-adenosyl-L-methionine-dependent methyltransferase [Parathielavia appendiculata]|uniref:S-adenosyl-L-methionine-dependent methyltransferase n=1 Tax=Parathielavia appendiculata TaxID=2587402 RepID=A0AAN6Z6B2_9PEZI|nr:S-adenosyl-L-methionine-dependent methyltransferase [Parathielavia appendiculata]
MTSANNTRFSAEALTWDSNPDVQLATALAHKAYLAHLPPAPTLSTYNVLDLGCGTGLLSLALAPSVLSVTAVDAAEGMIAALESKLASPDTNNNNINNTPRNVLPVCALLQDPDDPRLATDPATGETVPTGRRFDLVVSHLVLHHIPDLPALLKTIHGCLVPGGRVMVTDFEDTGPEARRFHPEGKMDGVERHGITEGEMRRVMEGAGFAEVRVERAFEMGKKVETEPGSGVLGPVVVFPFLICEGTKG